MKRIKSLIKAQLTPLYMDGEVNHKSIETCAKMLGYSGCGILRGGNESELEAINFF